MNDRVDGYHETGWGGDEDEEYRAFVEKFRPKKTTDDCYTPPAVYDAVAGWVSREYHISRTRFVRPFYPGGCYTTEEYPDWAVVVDNPPFSILSEILTFFLNNGIHFFLFCPLLTAFNNFSRKKIDKVCLIMAGASVTYDNGAVVRTAFVTDLDDEWIVRSAPDLLEAIELAQHREDRSQPVYEYPDYVLTQRIYSLSEYGIDYRVSRGDAKFVRALDSQRATGKTIYGGGLLLSERAAAERAAAERAAAERAAAQKRDVTVWSLSDREKEIISNLGRGIT